MSTGNTLDTSFVVDDAGQVRSQTVTNGPFSATTSYSYDATDTFQTAIQLPTPASNVALAISASFDANSGALVSSTGLNSGQTTTVQQYDPLLRPKSVVLPNGSQVTNIYYNPNQTGAKQSIGNGASTDTETLLDGYGRKSRVAILDGQTTNPWYQIDYCYSATGLLAFQHSAYQANGFATPKQCSGSGDSFTYDALGRPTSVAHADGSSTAYTYFSRAVKQVDSPGAAKIMQYDVLGRVTAVCELSSNSSMPGSGSPAACGTDYPGTGFLTNYAYDIPNHKVTVTQGAQTRIFQTDDAGRPTYVHEPERGDTSYTYAYNATGLAVTRVRPRTNQINPSVTTQAVSQYDKVGRLLTVSYNDGTPTKQFFYDWVGNGGSIPDAGASKGQLTGMSNGQHSRSYAYDNMGRVSQWVECVADWCGQPKDIYRFFGYDYLGNLTTDRYSTSANGGSYATVTYGYNQAGQVTFIGGGQNDGSLSPTLYSASQMGPFGATLAQLGNGLNTPFQYDQVGRVSGGWACVGSDQPGCPGGTMQYGFLNTTVGAQVQQVSDIVLQRTSVYGYDEFNRLTSSNNKNAGESLLTTNLTYDRYGNRWTESVSSSGAAPNTSFSFNTATNQITGFAYDAAGNLLNDGVHTYSYDAENNLASIDGGSTAVYVYNNFNQRVKASAGGVTDRYGLDLAGRRSTTWLDGGTTLKLAQYYGDRGPLAFWASADNHTHFEQGDWLGTERRRTDNNGNVEMTSASLPFGEPVGSSGPDLSPSHFALLDQDLSADSGLSHATYREYSSTQGRWTSPDPYDGSYDASNPESLNRYSYVLNNPLAYIDPDGTTCVTEVCVDVDSGPYSPVGIILNSFAPPISPVGNPSPGGGNFPGGLGYTGPGVVIPTNTADAAQAASAKSSACSLLAAGGGLKSFFGLPLNMQAGPPGPSTVIRTVRRGIEETAPVIPIVVFRVGGSIAAKAAEDAIPIVGQLLLAYQTGQAMYDAAKVYQDCMAH